MGDLSAATVDSTWWKDGTVYQIWPASYKDSNGDGIGDIPGIISTLDYLKDLGIDIIWVSPAYASPQVDMGYDISDYEAIDPQYGSLADAEELIQECHARSMRIMFDLVVNHTSDQHAWFRDSRSSKSSPKRDWYIWRPAKHDGDGKRQPPNNWRAHFGGSAWTWDEGSQEYYFHLFCPEQPDLNWETPATRQAIFASAMKFWLDRGVDGFRVDTVNMYSKTTSFPDAPIRDASAAYQFEPSLFCNGPKMHAYLQEMHAQVLSKYDCCTVGELPHTPQAADVLRYVSAASRELDMVFQFDMVDLGQGADFKFRTRAYPLTDLKRILARFQRLTAGTDAWSTVFLENHDQARSISRYADDSPEHRAKCGKLLAILLATLTGTLFLYQGQEIGTINTPSSWRADDYKDVEALNYIAMVRAQHADEDPAFGPAMQDALRGVQAVGRDNARTPVQWDDSPHAGFTAGGGEPWMRVHDAYRDINVEQQLRDPDSVLNFWKRMLGLRKEHRDVWIHGAFEMSDVEDDEERIVFVKTGGGGERVLVVLNMTGKEVGWRVPEGIRESELRLLVGNLEGEGEVEVGVLRGWEGRVYTVG